MKILLAFISIILFFGLLFAYPILLYGSSQTVEDCVVKAERIVKSDSSKYLIFGEKEVYQNTDTILRFKFNSSDFYKDIEEGSCYKFNVQGWRVPFLSWYRNIYGFEQKTTNSVKPTSYLRDL